MTAPDALPGFLGLVPGGMPFTNAVAARVGLAISTHFPGRAASRVQAPILFCVCDSDTVAPAGATRRHAASAPRGEVIRYPFGHFDIYTGDEFERAVTDQVEFLNRHLSSARGDHGHDRAQA
jgi:hypothetical protein